MCPCGARGDPAVECACSPQRLAAYREKLSRALLDRFDLAVAMPRPRAAELAAPPSRGVGGRAGTRARGARAAARASLPRRTEAASELLSSAVDRLPLSGRGRARVARVARTIAALARRRRRSSRRTSPRRSRTGCRESFRAAMSEVRCMRRRDAGVPVAARRDPRPAAAALPARGAARRAARPACRRRRRCAGVLVVRALGRAVARPRARGGRPRRRQRDGARDRRRGAPRSARGGGTTVAVLGCGVDRDYPAAHAELARRICETGLVVSEYEPGVEPARGASLRGTGSSPGSVQATVVVEARERSGALITADFALEEGRDVLAVPGEITSRALGGDERAAPARRDAGDVRGRTCSSSSASSRAADGGRARRESRRRSLARLRRRRAHGRRARAGVRRSIRREGAAALMELELAGG